MDPAIVSFLTMLATAVLNAAANRAGEIPVEKVFEVLPSLPSFLLNTMRKPEFRKAVEQVRDNPSDPMAQLEVQKQLQRLVTVVTEELAIALQLQKLVNLNKYLAPMNSITPDQIKEALKPF